MAFNFSGSSVIITGAASGIGKAVALGFALSGAKVLASDVNLRGLRELQNQANSRLLNLSIKETDVCERGNVEELFYESVSQGPVNALIHCAGITIQKHFTETSQDEYRKLIETNLSGTFYCLQEAASRMKTQESGGSIVVISSINALWPLPSQAVYTSTKAAIESMSKCLAAEVAPLKIRVNTIAPGAIDTPMNEGLQEEQRALLSKRIPTGRIGVPQDLVGAALFLASPQAEYITGSTLVVDGGYMVSR